MKPEGLATGLKAIIPTVADQLGKTERKLREVYFESCLKDPGLCTLRQTRGIQKMDAVSRQPLWRTSAARGTWNLSFPWFCHNIPLLTPASLVVLSCHAVSEMSHNRCAKYRAISEW